jgi:hypothetical protein
MPRHQTHQSHMPARACQSVQKQQNVSAGTLLRHRQKHRGKIELQLPPTLRIGRSDRDIFIEHQRSRR